LQPLL